MREKIKDRILEKCDHKCVRCGATKNLEVDHVIPVSKGGLHDEDNMQILCKKCNQKKYNKINYMDFFVIDRNPDFMLIDTKFAELMRYHSHQEISNIFVAAADMHKKYWVKRGHKYE